ncbi:MAG: efflux RND transporter permease subunit [Phycisphaeraceae bacterium]|nr:efflux RND transporter permease subunit [Phycisphaeraceae bacterium]
MNFAELFIRRPVTTTLLMLGVLCFGSLAYMQLPVSDLPTVDYPTVQVSANLAGASPETMASTVALPLEREFSAIAGLDSMTSASVQGSSQITLQFTLDRDIDAAAQDVSAAISRAQRRLPADMTTPPSYSKVNPADAPVLLLSLTSPTLPLYMLDEYAQTLLAQQISMVSGVAQVQVYGSQKYAVRVQLDPRLLATRDIGLNEVTAALRRSNVNLPVGQIDGPDQSLTLETSGQLSDAAAYRPLIVAYRDGQPVRLEQLGRVVDSVENNKVAAWFVDQRAIVLAVQRQPGANTIAVVDAVKDLLPTFNALLPGAVSLHQLIDRSQSIRASIHEIELTLMLSLVLVVGVIFAFLRSLRATTIPSLAIPISLIGAFAVMYLLGFSANNLSLMALILSVGFVIDDAIVMLENIVRHQEMGKPLRAASLEGSREISFTIVSMTLSLAAVFIPFLFMGGVLGRLLHEFAVTIAAAILISGFVSLSLTPMLASRFLKGHGTKKHGHVYALSEKVFEWMLGAYEVGLRWSLGHRRAMVGFSAAVLAGTGWLFVAVPKGFLPSEDIDQISISTEAAQGTSFPAMMRYQQAVAAIVRDDPNVDVFMSSCGARGVSGGNAGRMLVRLKPRDQRELSADEVIQALRPKLAQVPGMRVYLQNPPPIRLGGQASKSQYQYTLQSPDTDALYAAALRLADSMSGLAELQDVTTDLQLSNPQLHVEVDRDKAAALGVSVEEVEQALYSSFGARQVTTIYAPNNEYNVVLELLDEFQADPASLGLLYVRASTGKLVALSTLATVTRNVGPLSVNHSGQLPAVTVSFNLAPGYALGQAVSAIDELAARELPASITTRFSGAAEVFQESLRSLAWLLVLAIVVIYIILGILYESFIHPLTILTALPFAGFGALVTLALFGAELDVYAFVGVVMLIGLVKKNGIMMVDFAIEAQRQGKAAEEAIYEACLVRFRPIMMTTLAALMGTLPIALGFGAGAESRRPLGLAVVGGLVFSQFLTLYVTPVFYIYFDRLRPREGRGVEAGEGEPAAVAA